MNSEIIQLSVRKPVMKILVIVLLLFCAGWSYFVIRWYLGNSLAEYFNTTENSLQMAELASSLAPSDPLPHWRLATVSQGKLPPDQQGAAIAEFEQAVRLSPNDYRFWMALGTAYERSGDSLKGEQALRRSIALAPAYAYPHWYLGNLLLRANRYDEAFSELRLASDSDLELRPQMFNLIWAVYGTDHEGLKKAIGTQPTPRAEFAAYLLTQKKFEEGLLIWNSLSAEDKKLNHVVGDSLVNTLVQEQLYHYALQVWNDITSASELRAEIDRMLDGSFETNIPYSTNAVFSWQVTDGPQVQIGIDPAKAHSGTRSLRITFSVRSRLDGINASELVAVTPDKQYDFECYVSTKKLESGTTPRIQIIDPADGTALATSDQSPNGDSDWNRIGLSFKTGPKTQGIRIKIMREPCSDDNTVCPAFGAIWYDDFIIKRKD